MIREMRREINIWMEGYGDKLLSPAYLQLDNKSLCISETYLEITDEKILPCSIPIKLFIMPWLQLITQAGEQIKKDGNSSPC